MQLYSVIKNDGPHGLLAWKFTGEDFNYGSQLIVAESEEALFFKDGIIQEIFEGGRYALATSNYPFITSIRNMFSGGTSAFNCRVYFINKAHQLELKWGTDSPIQMLDPYHEIQTNISARGSYTIQVADSKKFLIKMIGNNIQYFTNDELNTYFRSAFMQYIKDEIPRSIRASGQEILVSIESDKTRIAESLITVLNNRLDEYGIRLVNFYISAIEIPPGDPSRATLERARSSRAELRTLGGEWGKVQARDILRDIANNPGAGGVAAAGAGLGMGIAAGGVFGDMASQMFHARVGQNDQQSPLIQQQPLQTEPNNTQKSVTPQQLAECASCHAKNALGSKFCNECGTKMIVAQVYCNNCGTELPEAAKFCNECGTRRM